MEFDDHIESLFLHNAPSFELQQAAVGRGMRTLRRDALDKVEAGYHEPRGSRQGGGLDGPNRAARDRARARQRRGGRAARRGRLRRRGDEHARRTPQRPSGACRCRTWARWGSATSPTSWACRPPNAPTASWGRNAERSRRQGHHHRPLGDDGAHADARVSHLPGRLPARGHGRVHARDGSRVARQLPGERHRDHPGAGRRARGDRQADRLHQRRQRLPDRGARGRHPDRAALPICARSRARRSWSASTRSGASSRGRSSGPMRRRLPAHPPAPRLRGRAVRADGPRHPRRRRGSCRTASARSARSSRGAASASRRTPRTTCTASTTS